MNSEKQRQAITEQELQEDITYVQEVHKNDLEELKGKKKNSFTALCVVFLVFSLICLAISAYALLTSLISAPAYRYTACMLAAGSLVLLLTSILLLVHRPKRDLKPVREDLCPEFVPEKNLTLSGNEPLAKSDAPVIRKIVVDPNKRKAKLDARKVARYVDPGLTFSKMKDALRASLSSSGYELSEVDLGFALSRLGHSRVIFLSGLNETEARAFSLALASAFAWSQEFIADPSTSFDDLRKATQVNPEGKNSAVLSLFGLGASRCESYFSGYVEALSDCSAPRTVNEDFTLSNNLLVLVYLPKGDERRGIPSLLLRYGTLFAPRLVEAKEKGGEFEPVRTTIDEIRYLASKKVREFFFDEQFSASFDCFARFEEAHGSPMPNDAENALERMEAVELGFKVSQEEVAGDVLTSNLLPYYLSKYPLAELSEPDGLFSELKKEFSGAIESKIESCIASFKASLSEAKEEVAEEKEAARVEEKTIPEEKEAAAKEEEPTAPMEEAPAEEKEASAPKEETAPEGEEGK